jgi:uncharacterized protein (TIGR03000 family)
VEPGTLEALRGRFALLDVRLRPDARLWFNDYPVRQQGPERAFQTPPLKPGRNYYYVVKASWAEDGRPVEQTRRVPVHAGEHVVLDFTRPVR